uniref:ParB/RepB/Spo0J family partition protein n=1 Tax=Saccharothrix espanaensis TaxID=103731 RepID=UPI003F4966F2
METRLVPVSAVAHNPGNRRESYDTDDVRALAASIAEVGLLHPIGVVRYEIYLNHHPEHEEAIGTHDWVALYGNQRLAAARLAGIEHVPALVVDRLAREGKLLDAVAIENLQRSQLPPMREAEELADLVQRHGSQRVVAARLGVSQGFVSQRLKLLKLGPELRAALAAGTLRVEDARSLAGMPVADQVAAWNALTSERASPGDYAVISPEEDRHADRQATSPPPRATPRPPATTHRTDATTAGAQATPPGPAADAGIPIPHGTVPEIGEYLTGILSRDQITELVDFLTGRTDQPARSTDRRG